MLNKYIYMYLPFIFTKLSETKHKEDRCWNVKSRRQRFHYVHNYSLTIAKNHVIFRYYILYRHFTVSDFFCHFISTDDFQKIIRRNVYFSYKTTF